MQVWARWEELRLAEEQPRPVGARKPARQPPQADALSPGQQAVWSQSPEEPGQEQRYLRLDEAAGRYVVALLQQEQPRRQKVPMERQLQLARARTLRRLAALQEHLRPEAEERQPPLDVVALPWRQPLPACAPGWP